MDSAQRIIAGAMSGTSADGVDVVLARVAGRGTSMTATLLHHLHRPYDAATRGEIFAFRGGDAATNLARLAQLGRTISLTYAAAINESLAASGLSAADLAAVAAHGQTLYHDPPNTIQWFDPALVAAEVGCPVVSDFRRADLAAGGQGAPLVPFADYVLFGHADRSRILLNIGGIANLTYLPARATPEQLIAFDTGPGNCISDYLARRFDPAGPGYDRNGARAARGAVSGNVVCHMLESPYIQAAPPKSTDGPQMIALWEAALRSLPAPLPQDDLFATACGICSASIADSIVRVLPDERFEVIVSGGGTSNPVLMDLLRRDLEDAGHTLRTMGEFGIPADAKEAMAFALLAAATLDGEPSNVPSVTGAKRAVVLGSITPRPGPGVSG